MSANAFVHALTHGHGLFYRGMQQETAAVPGFFKKNAAGQPPNACLYAKKRGKALLIFE
ncbi:MAG: hypothetical protein HFH60_12465 [Lachnospiraceae bacterium]|nr:hypothetical protein [Lachnospiraceae bacterium]